MIINHEKLDFSGQLGKEHIREMEAYNKFDKDKLEEHYDKVALNYEQLYLRCGYPDPKKV